MIALDEETIAKHLGGVSEWNRAGSSITRLWTFKNFAEAMCFVNAVAELAEKENHHPDITIQWNKVTLSLSTHSAGGLTERDFELAKKIDVLEWA